MFGVHGCNQSLVRRLHWNNIIGRILLGQYYWDNIIGTILLGEYYWDNVVGRGSNGTKIHGMCPLCVHEHLLLIRYMSSNGRKG